jgi:hypothetical protein
MLFFFIFNRIEKRITPLMDRRKIIMNMPVKTRSNPVIIPNPLNMTIISANVI